MLFIRKHSWVEVNRQFLMRDNRRPFFHDYNPLPSPVTLITEQRDDKKKYRQLMLEGHIPQGEDNGRDQR